MLLKCPRHPWFECFTDLNLLNMHSMLIKTEKPILYNFIQWCYILFAVMIEDESSWLKMPNWPAVSASYWPLSTALYP